MMKCLSPLIVTVSLLALGSMASAQPQKPNVIFILADDLGYADLGCYGQQKIQTPHLDRMASEGLRFSQFYSGNTVCAPSRCTLMTGLHNGHAPVRGNREVKPEGQEPMPGDTFTIAKMFKLAGYDTSLIGKWGLGYPGSPSDPLTQGFEHFYGYNCQRHAHEAYPHYLWRNDRRIDVPENKDGKRGLYSLDMFEQETLTFLAKKHTQPFFLYLALSTPHADLLVPKDSEAPYAGRWTETPFVKDGTGGEGSMPESDIGAYLSSPTPRATYAGMVSRLDRTVGRVLAELKKLKLEENTLVIFTSDNGPHREAGCDPDFFDSNGPLTGYKRDLNEGGIRVPFIARWPGRVPAGKDSAQVGYFGDMMATFAALIGQPLPKTPFDSVSLVPTLTGSGTQTNHDYLYWEFYEKGVSQAVLLDGRWKAIRLREITAPIQLYDLSNDIGETKDVALQQPALVKRSVEIMRSAHIDNATWKIPGLSQ